MDNGASQATGLSQVEPVPVSPVPASIPCAVEPMVLVALDDPEQKPRLFACRTCGSAYSVKNIGIPNARDMAINCQECHPKQYRCDMCDCETPKYWMRCGSCRTQVKISNAVEIEDDGGPYFEIDGDGFFHELDEAQDHDCEWVFPSTMTYPRLCAETVLETLLDDMHEDASIDDLDGVKEFFEAVERFNEAQTTRSYWPDEKRKIRVPASATEAGTAATLGAVHDGAVPTADAQTQSEAS